MIHVTCRLTAKNRDQLRDPTLGNRVWAAFFTTTALRSAVNASSVVFTATSEAEYRGAVVGLFSGARLRYAVLEGGTGARDQRTGEKCRRTSGQTPVLHLRIYELLSSSFPPHLRETAPLLFGHVARADPQQDHRRVTGASLRPPSHWRRPCGRHRTTWLCFSVMCLLIGW